MSSSPVRIALTRSELVRFGLLRLGDQYSAEEVVQDAFGLQRGLVRLCDPAKTLAYLRASVVNGCRSVQRRS